MEHLISGLPMLEQGCDTTVIFKLTEGVEAGEARYKHDVKTFSGWAPRLLIGHGSRPPQLFTTIIPPSHTNRAPTRNLHSNGALAAEVIEDSCHAMSVSEGNRRGRDRPHSPHLMRTRIRFVIYAPAVGKNQRLGDSAWSIAWRWGWLYISGRPGSRNGNPRL